jgi:hypothetical protein
MKVYMVVVYKAGTRPGNWYTRTRTWGFYFDFETAEQAILENWTDMFECDYYDRAVIEEQCQGICTGAKALAWYTAVYDSEDNDPRVFETAAPEWSKNLINMWGG